MSDTSAIVNITFSIGIAIFPSIGFLYQYHLIRKRHSVGSFSIKVCGVLILSSLLRIGFYIYQEFSIALLCQSILMILVQMALLRLCVNTMNNEEYLQKEHKNNQGEQSQSIFWKWKKLRYYMITITVAACAILLLSLTIHEYGLHIMGEGLGYAALLADACFIIPQLVQNLKQDRVKGISHLFVFLNTTQDVLQLIFVLIYAQPIQFILFNALQVIINIILILQIIHYKLMRKQQQAEQFKEIVQQQEHLRHEQIKSDHRMNLGLKNKVQQQVRTADPSDKQTEQKNEPTAQIQHQLQHNIDQVAITTQ